MFDVVKISLITLVIATLIREKKTPLSWYGKLINRFPWYFCRPLGGCYKCFTGQVCLWYFFFTKPFNIIEWLFFISSGILLSMVWNKIYCYLK